MGHYRRGTDIDHSVRKAAGLALHTSTIAPYSVVEIASEAVLSVLPAGLSVMIARLHHCLSTKLERRLQ